MTAQALLVMLTLFALLSPEVALSSLPDDQAAAVSLARKTIASKTRSDPAELELLAIVPSASIPPGSRCLDRHDFEGPDAWFVRLRRGGSTYDVLVKGGRAAICDVGNAHRPPPGPGIVESGLAPRVAEARQDLAERLSVSPGAIEVREAITVVWPDSSAGCPRKDWEYLQVQTPGIRIILRVGGRDYQYHARRGETPTLCERPSPVEPRRAETS
jgi:hypothetical protein